MLVRLLVHIAIRPLDWSKVVENSAPSKDSTYLQVSRLFIKSSETLEMTLSPIDLKDCPLRQGCVELDVGKGDKTQRQFGVPRSYETE